MGFDYVFLHAHTIPLCETFTLQNHKSQTPRTDPELL